jgi:ParB/RepB/Spo0J family partition protein
LQQSAQACISRKESFTMPDHLAISIPLVHLHPNPWNLRPAGPDPDDDGLVTTIRSQGILQNLVVRPLGDGDFHILAGERRWRCAGAAGLTEVPCVVRDLGDAEAKAVTLIENLQRRTLPWLEEVRGVENLLGEGWAPERIAGESGRSVSWVHRRRRLLNLSPAWRAVAENPAAAPFAERWGVSHFELVSLLAPDSQDELLEEQHHGRLRGFDTAAGLARWLGSRMRAVSSFPWPLTDAELDPAAGACSGCPLRSSQNPGLFDAQATEVPLEASPRKRGAPPDQCLSPKCAARKLALFIDRRQAQLAAKHSTVLLLRSPIDNTTPCPPEAVSELSVAPAKKDEAGAVPALMTTGPDAGRLRWVRPLRTSAPAPRRTKQAPRQLSAAERQAERQRLCYLYATDAVVEAVRAAPAPALDVSIRCAIVFGTQHKHVSTLEWGQPDSDWLRQLVHQGVQEETAATRTEDTAAGAADAAGGASAEPAHDGSYTGLLWRALDRLRQESASPKLAQYLWERVAPVLCARMKSTGPALHVRDCWEEAQRIAALLAIDAQAFLQQAEQALPAKAAPRGNAKATEVAPAGEILEHPARRGGLAPATRPPKARPASSATAARRQGQKARIASAPAPDPRFQRKQASPARTTHTAAPKRQAGDHGGKSTPRT